MYAIFYRTWKGIEADFWLVIYSKHSNRDDKCYQVWSSFETIQLVPFGKIRFRPYIWIMVVDIVLLLWFTWNYPILQWHWCFDCSTHNWMVLNYTFSLITKPYPNISWYSMQSIAIDIYVYSCSGNSCKYWSINKRVIVERVNLWSVRGQQPTYFDKAVKLFITSFDRLTLGHTIHIMIYSPNWLNEHVNFSMWAWVRCVCCVWIPAVKRSFES